MVGEVRLTQRTVEDARCPPGRKDALLFDRDLRGFALRVGSTGGKTFLVQFNVAGERRRLALGAFGILTVDEARKRALASLGDVAKGVDPVAERRAIIATRKAAVMASKVRAEEDAFTFGRLVDSWVDAREGERRPGYLATARTTMKLHLKAWLNRPASSITTMEAVRALDAIKATGSTVTANRALAYARAAYGWALRRQVVACNPLTGIEAPTEERSRDRVLSAEELGAVWRAAGKLTTPYDAFMRALLLTLQRRDEVAHMRWSELSADLTTWTLPRERAKNDKAHIVHLAEPVRDMLARVPRFAGCPFVFPSSSMKPISGYAWAKRTIDAAVTVERVEAGIEPAELSNWRFHDFRRAGVTALAGMGFAPHVCDRLLNHVSGAIQGVAAVYQRAEFLTERKAALDAWAAHVLRAAEARPGPAG